MATERNNKIQLSDIIVNLRKEILEAQEKGKDQGLKFSVEDIEVELQVTASAEGTVKGGVKFWVYSAEAAGTLTTQSLHKVKLKLKPKPGGSDDKELLISDKDKKPWPKQD